MSSSKATSSNSRKRTVATATPTSSDIASTMRNGGTLTDQNDPKGTTTGGNGAAKRNKFANTPTVSTTIEGTEYTIMDVQRLLQVMETTTPPVAAEDNNNNTPITTNSWKDYELRAQLLQDMYTKVYNERLHATTLSAGATRSSSKKEQQQQVYDAIQLKVLKELQPRIQTILKVTENYIMTLKEQQQNTASTDPFHKLFPPKVDTTSKATKTPVVVVNGTATSNTTTTTTSRGMTKQNETTHTVVVAQQKPPPVSVTTNHKVTSKVSNINTTKNSNTTRSSSSIEVLQQQQREQMEMAVSQMATQLKLQTQNINEQIQKQNENIIEDLHTTMEQNVHDVTVVTKQTQQHVSNSSRRSYSTWTMIIIMIITFIITLFFILTIPKPNTPKYIKYIKDPSSIPSNSNNNNDTHICRLLPSGIEECYYIPDITTTTDNVKSERDSKEISDVQDDTSQQQNIQNAQQYREIIEDEPIIEDKTTDVNVEIFPKDESVVDVKDQDDPNNNIAPVELPFDQLYSELRQMAISTDINRPMVQQHLQLYPSLIYYTDPNGWSILHELARSSTMSTSATEINSELVQDQIEVMQYIIAENATLRDLTTQVGWTPYDLAKKNINSMIESSLPELYQTILTLLQPPSPTKPDVSESGSGTTDTIVLEDGIPPDELPTEIDITQPSENEMMETDMEVESTPDDEIVEPDVETDEDEEQYIEGLSIFELAKHAIAFNDLDVFRNYLNEYPSLLYDIDEDDNGMSLLHYAVRQKHSDDIVQYLIETSIMAMENADDDDEEEVYPIWTIMTYGIVNDVTGVVEVPPQTPYDMALDIYSNDPDHPMLQYLHDLTMVADPHDEVLVEEEEEETDEDKANSSDGIDDNECDIDVTTGLCRTATATESVQQKVDDVVDDEFDVLFQKIPEDNDDILKDALRDFDDMQRG